MDKQVKVVYDHSLQKSLAADLVAGVLNQGVQESVE